MNINQVKRYLREAASVLGAFLAVSNTIALPSNVRATLLAVSGAIIAVDQAVSRIQHPPKPKAPSVVDHPATKVGP